MDDTSRVSRGDFMIGGRPDEGGISLAQLRAFRAQELLDDSSVTTASERIVGLGGGAIVSSLTPIFDARVEQAKNGILEDVRRRGVVQGIINT